MVHAVLRIAELIVSNSSPAHQIEFPKHGNTQFSFFHLLAPQQKHFRYVPLR